MGNDYNPKNCGYAVNVQGTVVCRLNCTICKQPCAKEKQDKAIAEFVKYFRETERKDDEQDD